MANPPRAVPAFHHQIHHPSGTSLGLMLLNARQVVTQVLDQPFHCHFIPVLLDRKNRPPHRHLRRSVRCERFAKSHYLRHILLGKFPAMSLRQRSQVRRRRPQYRRGRTCASPIRPVARDAMFRVHPLSRRHSRRRNWRRLILRPACANHQRRRYHQTFRVHLAPLLFWN